MIRRLVIIVGLTLACSAAFASQSLTLNLESPSLEKADHSLSATSSTKTTAIPTTRTTAKSTGTTVKIGHVGMVTTTAVIYKSRSSSSRAYARVKPETPLAITHEEDGKWLGVLMANGATGWIPRQCVKMIGYDLIAKKADVDRATATSRGSSTSRSVLPDSDIIRTAMQYAGVPYVYGGTSPTSGMDCSAFVRSVFSQYGVSLPRTAREQAQVGSSVPFDQLQPGDRLYFACKNPYPDHCGIYAGNGYFIHCSSRKKGVAIDALSSDFFSRSLVAARRS